MPTIISDYFWVYSEDLSHIMEVQIVHPFAAVSFKENSEGRDNPSHLSLWEPDERGCFFVRVQREIIDQRESGDVFERFYRELQARHAEAGNGCDVSDGMRGVLYSLAAQWHERAAKQGHGHAQCMLGDC